MRHTASADLGVPGVRPGSFPSLSARIRPSGIAFAVLMGALAALSSAARAEDAVSLPRAVPAAFFEWNQPTAGEIVLLGVAEALIIVDVLQTLDWDRQGQPGAEINPFLGRHPSRAKIILMGGVLPGLLLAAAWYALPSGWRAGLPIGVGIAESGVVVANHLDGLRVRF